MADQETLRHKDPQFQATLIGTIDPEAADILLDGAFVVNAGSDAVVSVAGQAEGFVGPEAYVGGRFAAR